MIVKASRPSRPAADQRRMRRPTKRNRKQGGLDQCGQEQPKNLRFRQKRRRAIRCGATRGLAEQVRNTGILKLLGPGRWILDPLQTFSARATGPRPGKGIPGGGWLGPWRPATRPCAGEIWHGGSGKVADIGSLRGRAPSPAATPARARQRSASQVWSRARHRPWTASWIRPWFQEVRARIGAVKACYEAGAQAQCPT